MGWLKSIFGNESAGGVIDEAGGFLKDVRSTITGEADPQKKIELLGKALDLAGGIMEAKSSIILAEAQGHSWLQRNWRPVAMLTFLVLVVLDAFAVLPNPIAEDMWDLLKIGLGGYVVGRSAEKIVDKLKVK